jgi:hypothetical protein
VRALRDALWYLLGVGFVGLAVLPVCAAVASAIISSAGAIHGFHGQDCVFEPCTATSGTNLPGWIVIWLGPLTVFVTLVLVWALVRAVEWAWGRADRVAYEEAGDRHDVTDKQE